MLMKPFIVFTTFITGVAVLILSILMWTSVLDIYTTFTIPLTNIVIENTILYPSITLALYIMTQTFISNMNIYTNHYIERGENSLLLSKHLVIPIDKNIGKSKAFSNYGSFLFTFMIINVVLFLFGDSKFIWLQVLILIPLYVIVSALFSYINNKLINKYKEEYIHFLNNKDKEHISTKLEKIQKHLSILKCLDQNTKNNLLKHAKNTEHLYQLQTLEKRLKQLCEDEEDIEDYNHELNQDIHKLKQFIAE